MITTTTIATMIPTIIATIIPTKQATIKIKIKEIKIKIIKQVLQFMQEPKMLTMMHQN